MIESREKPLRSRLSARQLGGGHELLLRAPQGEHPLVLSLFRPHPAEWVDSAVSATGESGRLLQYVEALGCAPEHYTLASLRYDLSKLRAKGLVAKIPNSRRYQLLPQGYSICLVFLKLFERVYAPLTAGLLSPVKADFRLESQRRSQLDRLYQRVIDDLDTLVRAIGLKAA